MATVGVFDAKTHLYALLERVSRGETIRTTRRGVPIVKLVPDNDRDRSNPADLVRDIRRVRKGAKIGELTMRELINEGRRLGSRSLGT